MFECRGGSGQRFHAGKIVVAVTGSESGSIISKSLCRYLSWVGVSAKIFKDDDEIRSWLVCYDGQVAIYDPCYDVSRLQEQFSSEFQLIFLQVGGPEATQLAATQLAMSSIKIMGDKFVISRIKGYLPSRIACFLMNMHHSSKAVFLFKAHPVDNLPSDLAPGLQALISELGNRRGGDAVDLKVWASTEVDSVRICQMLEKRPAIKSSLQRLNLGVFSGLSDPELLEAIKSQDCEQYSRFMDDPYHHRFPRAESYFDLALRLENILTEVEGETCDLFISAHSSVISMFYSYFVTVDNVQDIPFFSFPDYSVLFLMLGEKETLVSLYGWEPSAGRFQLRKGSVCP